MTWLESWQSNCFEKYHRTTQSDELSTHEFNFSSTSDRSSIWNFLNIPLRYYFNAEMKLDPLAWEKKSYVILTKKENEIRVDFHLNSLFSWKGYYLNHISILLRLIIKRSTGNYVHFIISISFLFLQMFEFKANSSEFTLIFGRLAFWKIIFEGRGRVVRVKIKDVFLLTFTWVLCLKL